jgi:hypothetical protein
MAKRVPWKRVKAKGLGEPNQRLYERYAQAFEAANDLGQQLRDAVSWEWKNKYLNGLDGKVCIFNTIGGALMYVMKDKAKSGECVKDLFDANHGDDVFSHPSAGLTSDLTKDVDQRDALAIIGESLKHALSKRPEDEEAEAG